MSILDIHRRCERHRFAKGRVPNRKRFGSKFMFQGEPEEETKKTERDYIYVKFLL